MKSEKPEIPIPDQEIELGRKSYWAATVCLLAVCLLLTWQYKGIFEQSRTSDRLVVKTMTVGPAGDAPAYSFSGAVRGRYEIPMSFAASGRVSEILVAAGNAVKAGDTLMRLAVTQQAAEPAAASAGDGSAAQAQLAKAEADLKRYEPLYKQGAISRVMFERFQAAYDAALSNAQQAQSAVAAPRSAAAATPGILKTDFAGTVLAFDAAVGDAVNAGQRVLTLVREGAKEVELTVPEEQLEGFSKSESIRVTFEALPGMSVEARIRDSVPGPAESHSVKVRLVLISPPPEIKFGMAAAISAGGPGSVKPLVTVPLAAVAQLNAAPAIWLVVDHQATLRPVKLRSQDQETVRIIDGLQPGDVIVVSGVQTIWEGKRMD